jgi:drug/metabolite transporter (DMT)-like permease
MDLAVAASYSAFTTLFAISGKLTSSANTVLLQYSAPVYIAILAPWLLKERSSRRDYFLILMTFGGLCLLLLGPGQGEAGRHERLGLMAGAACGFFWALCVMLMRRQGAVSMPLSGLAVGNALTVLYCLPAMVQVAQAESFGSNLFWAALLGIGPLGIGYLFYLAAVGRVTALEAGLITSIEPILNPVWTYVVIAEIPGAWTLAGGAVVLLAVGLKAAGAWRSPAPAEA